MIDNDNNNLKQELTNNTPEEPVVTTEPQEAPIQEIDARDLEIARLQMQLDQMKAAANLKQAINEAQKSTGHLNTGMQDMARERIIQATGGPAKFYALTVTQRLAAQGEPAPTQAELDLLPKYFGAASSAREANALARQNPGLYRRLRALYKETT